MESEEKEVEPKFEAAVQVRGAGKHLAEAGETPSTRSTKLALGGIYNQPMQL